MYRSLENNISENLSISALEVQYFQLHIMYYRRCHKAMLETFHENVRYILFTTKILHFLEHQVRSTTCFVN